MIELILNALADLGIDAYRISQTESQSAEAFFVKKRLDLTRRTVLTDYTVSVYRAFERDGQKLLGACDAPIYPGMTGGEVKEALSSAWHAASFAGNPWYPLYRGKREDFLPSKSGFAGKSPEENLKTMADALFAADTCGDVFLNSAEIFSTRKLHRIVNSGGVDVSWETCEVSGEYVVQCPAPTDVETYHQFRCLEPDAASLRADVEKALTRTRDRAAASRPPKAGTYTVILSDEHMRELFSYYLDRSSSGMIYQKYSDFAVGRSVQGDGVWGDAVTVILKAADPYDGEGIPLRDRTLVENGVLRAIHGGARCAHYLGIEPTGQYRRIEVPSGSVPLADLKQRPHLYVAAFSDFQMNSLSGHFGGEIRLAYLYDGETVTPVTGGSVNGSILKCQKHMTFSRERYSSARYSGPLAVAIEGVAVAGLDG